MKKSLKQEAIVYFVNKFCKNPQNFTLRDCMTDLQEKKGIKVSIGALTGYLKDANVTCINRKWDFSQQFPFNYSIRELETYDFSKKVKEESDEAEEVASVEKISETVLVNKNVAQTPNIEEDKLSELNKKIDRLVMAIDVQHKMMKYDIESLKRSSIPTANISQVTLANYRAIADKLRDDNFAAEEPSRTRVISFRVTQLLKKQYEDFDTLYRLDNSDLLAALLYTFMKEQEP